jgi:hypothetical protein
MTSRTGSAHILLYCPMCGAVGTAGYPRCVACGGRLRAAKINVVTQRIEDLDEPEKN